MKTFMEFLALARDYSLELDALEEQGQFLDFKLRTTDHLREEILQILNKGTTVFEWVPETLAPGSGLGLISRETESLRDLFILNLRFNSFLAEAVSIRDAVLRLANAAFDLGLAPKACKALKIHTCITEIFKIEMGVVRGTGLEKWGAITLDPTLDELVDLRNQTTHERLVKLENQKPWEVARPAPGPGKWRSNFSVVVSPTKRVALGTFVTETADKVRERARIVLHTLHSTLDMLMWQRGGPKAAALRRAWKSAGHTAPCPHGTVDEAADAGGPVLDSAIVNGVREWPSRTIYYCVACGQRVLDIKGRKSTHGGTYFSD